ncbi:hypothetical protein AB0M19_11720 [Streptomyces sp. NPDC051920]|uniref:hypothetical protein n=1 Tax=Streptomyces sp. NPDC051920 TaxID=3155523 RepID=UPI00341599AD
MSRARLVKHSRRDLITWSAQFSEHSLLQLDRDRFGHDGEFGVRVERLALTHTSPPGP